MIKSENDKKEFKDILLNEMKQNEAKQTEPPIEPPNKKQKANSRIKITDHFNDDSETEEDISVLENSLVEFEKYFNAKFFNENTDDLLKFWYEHSNEYPILFNIVKKILPVPATEFESEGNFSVTGRVRESRRSRLDPENVDHLVFIKNHSKL